MGDAGKLLDREEAVALDVVEPYGHLPGEDEGHFLARFRYGFAVDAIAPQFRSAVNWLACLQRREIMLLPALSILTDTHPSLGAQPVSRSAPVLLPRRQSVAATSDGVQRADVLSSSRALVRPPVRSFRRRRQGSERLPSIAPVPYALRAAVLPPTATVTAGLSGRSTIRRTVAVAAPRLARGSPTPPTMRRGVQLLVSAMALRSAAHGLLGQTLEHEV